MNENTKGKQETVREFLLNDIRLGVLKPGDKLYSRSVFMKKFGCARGTIDQAVQNLIKIGVLTSEKGRGTYVANTERGETTGHIAIITRKGHALDLVKSISDGMFEGLGNQFKTTFYSFDDLRHPSSWKECLTHSVLIFLLPDAEQESFLVETRRLKIPHLVIYRDPPESPFISIDNIGGAANLVDSLAKSGHKKIAFASWKQSRYHFAEQIYTGYLEGLIRNKLPRIDNLVGFCQIHNEEALLKQIFSGEQIPDALVFYGIPVEKIKAWCKKKKLTIGKNISLANYNYVTPGEYDVPMLSPIPVEHQIGIAAAKQIKNLSENQGAFPQIYLTPKAVF